MIINQTSTMNQRKQTLMMSQTLKKRKKKKNLIQIMWRWSFLHKGFLHIGQLTEKFKIRSGMYMPQEDQR